MEVLSKRAIWSRNTALAVDRITIEDYGMTSLDLMEEAGLRVANSAIKRLVNFDLVLVLVGPGNNGGDGLVAARHISRVFKNTQVLMVCHKGAKETEAFNTQINKFGKDAVKKYLGNISDLLAGRIFIIDALIGVGQRGRLRDGVYKEVLEKIADYPHKFVMAVDVPSGLQVDSWVESPPLQADVTITFGALKPSHVFSPGRSYCGHIEVAEIGFDSRAIKTAVDSQLDLFWDYDLVRSLEPWGKSLSAAGHKYQRGHVLIIGGSAGKYGAPIISATAALHAGAGWVSVALPSGLDRLADMPTEVTYESFFQAGSVDWDRAINFVKERRVKALCIGPGMMTTPFTQSSWQKLKALISDEGVFVVIDAGALAGLGPLLDTEPLKGDCLLTPHPGEWLKIHADNKPLDNLTAIAMAKSRIQAWGVEVFYKSATPFSVGMDGPVLVNNEGNNCLAKAGVGDMLAGLATILGTRMSTGFLGNLCQSYMAWSAARRENVYGYHGLSPYDIAKHVGAVIPK